MAASLSLPCLLYCTSASLFCQNKKATVHHYVRKHCTWTRDRCAHKHTTISIFVIEIWKVRTRGRWGWAMCVCVCVCVCLQGAGGGGALLLLVTVCFPPPQSICLLRLSTPSPQRERNLISLRGTELKDTETLRRCIYLCKAVSLSWLIWISNFGPCCYYIL